MFKASRLQVPNSFLLNNANLTGLARDFTDTREPNAVNPRWKFRDILWIDGEQKLKVVPTMECEHERVQSAPST